MELIILSIRLLGFREENVSVPAARLPLHSEPSLGKELTTNVAAMTLLLGDSSRSLSLRA